MNVPSYADSLAVLCLFAAENGRGPVLFGPCVDRVREIAPPFLVGNEFPSVYLEFPLMGEPFMDITMLLGPMECGTRVDSPLASGTEAMLDWYSGARYVHNDICCGYELDIKDPQSTAAGIHFQPRAHKDLVRPFCEAVGESERADLYLRQAERMPQEWEPAFFGMFRGRPDSPLRVCGYLSLSEVGLCAQDPDYIRAVFDQIGFTAYDEAMLSDVASFMEVAPGSVDFQFDVYPDGTLGSIFALDLQFEIEQPEAVQKSFEEGPTFRVMDLFQKYDMADDRWRLVSDTAFARAIPIELPDGSFGKFAFTLMPQWTKVRWKDRVLQPAKVYLLANATILDNEDSA